MVRALTEDLAGVPGVRLVQMQDARLRDVLEPRGNRVAIHSRQDELEQLAQWSARVDGVLLIAPESGGRLFERCEVVRESGGRLLSPSSTFVRLATDKCATAEQLAAHGVATPYAVLLPGDFAHASSRLDEPGTQRLPEQFPYPAVLKPIDGVGAMETYLIRHADDWPVTAGTDRVWRLEQFIPGAAVSVSALCGPRGATLLPPCCQQVTCNGQFRYLGGSYPLSPGLVRRACHLARRAFAALPATVGYVGIDMILTDEGSALADVVVDVNPRLTTSYIGLRQATSANLADTMLAVGRGESRPLFFQAERVQFDAEGRVTLSAL